MDSMEVNKGIAAVLVAGITFFLTGMIADNLVHETPLEKAAINIQGAPAEAAASTEAAKPEELPPIAPLLAKADVQAGNKYVHTVCTACHTFDQGGKDMVGPNLYGVVGAPHDHEAGFNYSTSLEKFKGQPWTYDDLNHWLDKPAQYAPGTRMTFAGIPSAQQRADVIAYLRSLSPNPEPLPSPDAAPPAAPAAAPPAGGDAGGKAAVAPKVHRGRLRQPSLAHQGMGRRRWRIGFGSRRAKACDPATPSAAGALRRPAAALPCRRAGLLRHRPLRRLSRPPSSAVGWPGGDAARMIAPMRNRPDYLAHVILGLGVVLFALPVWLVLAGSTQDSNAIARGELSLMPHLSGLGVYARVLTQGTMGTEPVWHMLLISLGMALAIAGGKIVISVLSAYAVVFFRFPGRQIAFWLIFVTLMLPVEVRIIPTYAVMADFGLINRFNGLWIPLIASATATLLFRQVFVAIPDELVEAARMDGAGPLRFLCDIVLPVSRANIAALFVILFVYGWNQYLWPLLVATNPGLDTIVIGIVKMIGVETQTDWSAVMATAGDGVAAAGGGGGADAALVRRRSDRGREVAALRTPCRSGRRVGCFGPVARSQ